MLFFALLFFSCSKSYKLVRKVMASIVGLSLGCGVLDECVGKEPQSPSIRFLLQQGTDNMRKGSLDESIIAFDKAIAQNPAIKSYLWQRGLALYLNKQYSDCADQFLSDITVNPGDTEEAIWHAICLAEAPSPVQVEPSREQKLLKLAEGDRRPVMRYIYEMFDGKISWQELDEYGKSMGGQSAYFYSRLYLSLYFHSRLGEDGMALKFINEAMNSSYAVDARSKDLMVVVGDLFRKNLIEKL